jgi:hypothetical protein
MKTQEANWRELFNVEQVEKPFNIQTEASECDGNCVTAKELKCVCRCGGRNHGAALRKNVKSLDTFNEDPVDQTFNPEEYQEELAVLA